MQQSEQKLADASTWEGFIQALTANPRHGSITNPLQAIRWAIEQLDRNARWTLEGRPSWPSDPDQLEWKERFPHAWVSLRKQADRLGGQMLLPPDYISNVLGPVTAALMELADMPLIQQPTNDANTPQREEDELRELEHDEQARWYWDTFLPSILAPAVTGLSALIQHHAGWRDAQRTTENRTAVEAEVRPAAEYVFRPERDGLFLVVWKGTERRYGGEEQFRQLHLLISNPDKEFTPAELEGNSREVPPPAPQPIPLADEEAKEKIRKNLEECYDNRRLTLEEEGEDSLEYRDNETKITELEHHLSQLTGLHGKDRVFPQATDKDAKAKRQALKYFWGDRFKDLPELTLHLDDYINKSGRALVYKPGTALVPWVTA